MGHDRDDKNLLILLHPWEYSTATAYASCSTFVVGIHGVKNPPPPSQDLA